MGQQQIVGHGRGDMICMKGMKDNMGGTMEERCIINENCHYLEENQQCISKNTIMKKLQLGTAEIMVGRSHSTLFSHEPSEHMHILPARTRRGNGYHVLQSNK